MSAPVVVPASAWRQQTWQPISRIHTPTPENWLHHSGPGAKTFATLLGNERYHVLTLNWRALGYSWAITMDRISHGYGRIFEGRGWGASGGHTKGRNTVSHGILLVGNWSTATRMEIAVAARTVAWLIDDGAAKGRTRRVMSGGHQQAPGASTACPGAAGMEVVRDVRQILSSTPSVPPPSPPEEDEMNAEQDARLRRVEEAVTDLSQVVNTLVSSIGGRNVGGDLQRLRLSQRAIGTQVGAPVNNEGPFDGTTVVS